jgi:hypothetical protein
MEEEWQRIGGLLSHRKLVEAMDSETRFQARQKMADALRKFRDGDPSALLAWDGPLPDRAEFVAAAAKAANTGGRPIEGMRWAYAAEALSYYRIWKFFLKECGINGYGLREQMQKQSVLYIIWLRRVGLDEGAERATAQEVREIIKCMNTPRNKWPKIYR